MEELMIQLVAAKAEYEQATQAEVASQVALSKASDFANEALCRKQTAAAALRVVLGELQKASGV